MSGLHGPHERALQTLLIEAVETLADNPVENSGGMVYLRRIRELSDLVQRIDTALLHAGALRALPGSRLHSLGLALVRRSDELWSLAGSLRRALRLPGGQQLRLWGRS
jgi:hypothetical protein